MIKQFAGTITSFLIYDSIIEEEEREVYQYGIEQILINFSTLVVIGIIAFSAKFCVQTVFWMCGMLPIRAVAGGYHASSPVKCNILTISIFILNILIINILKTYMTRYLFIAFLGLIFFSIIRFAPVDHKNKVLEQKEFLIVKRKSRIIGSIVFVVCLVMSLTFGIRNIFLISALVGALTASVSLTIGSIKRGGEENENDKCYS
jgi:accessory gene regulator B